MIQQKLALVLRVIIVVVLVATAAELHGIWTELKAIRKEQVKNMLYSLQSAEIDKIKNSSNPDDQLRHLESMLTVRGYVDASITGTVDANIENQPIEVTVSQR